MPYPTTRLEARASLLAFAIATAGASIHLAVDTLRGHAATTPATCPGQSARTVDRAEYLVAMREHCRVDGGTGCDEVFASVVTAVAAAEEVLGDDTVDHAFMRYSRVHRRIVWSVFDLDDASRLELSASDLRVLEYADESISD